MSAVGRPRERTRPLREVYRTGTAGETSRTPPDDRAGVSRTRPQEESPSSLRESAQAWKFGSPKTRPSGDHAVSRQWQYVVSHTQTSA